MFSQACASHSVQGCVSPHAAGRGGGGEGGSARCVDGGVWRCGQGSVHLPLPSPHMRTFPETTTEVGILLDPMYLNSHNSQNTTTNFGVNLSLN